MNEQQFQKEVMDEQKQLADPTVYLILNEIQSSLHAPKDQNNKFGKYNYRNAEGILQAVKPLLSGAIVTLQDDVVLIGDRFYVKATASITYDNQTITASAFAREDLVKKGMDVAQITGAASSYARKYALNGLFAIDDSKDDPDSKDNTKQAPIPDDVKDLAEYMREALSSEDYPVVYEHYMNVPTEHQAAVWGNFNSKQRSIMKVEFTKIREGE